MKILLLGATGMLGQSILKESKLRNIEICGIARNNSDLNINILEDKDLVKAVLEVYPDVIINAAALVNLAECENNPGLAYRINARPVAILAKLAATMNACLVQISTDHYYQKNRVKQHTEDHPVTLVNEYARSKYSGEMFAITAPRHLIIRTNIVGFRNKVGSPTFVEWVIESLKEKKRICLFDDFYTSSISVSQFSKVLFDLIEKGTSGVLNVASREVSSKKTFIEHLARRFDFSLDCAESGSLHMNSTIERADSLGLDVSNCEKILGYNLPELKDVIEDLFNEYQGR
ncbi:SDR family oxidoreductase [Paenibacillus dendritiformis]|uniref:SDR family oxidoreductase n=1 Tax=Paenibacillus dendritiformis TaxID=130049 RepID=UPI000DA8BDEC|nr:sugar nucleotide-binding protein [Paenibacillus dendritiformis]PZM67283.1 SDR family NAD(P)-dependent oxidoreductase [Paenibacillus dendritiformis]